MRKKSGFTIVERAIALVPEFEGVVRQLDQQVELRGQSKSTLNNYNRRILSVTDEKVTFIAKDYRKGDDKKRITLDGAEFLRRFTLHILPQRFVKIRRFGIYNPTFIRNSRLQFTAEKRPDIQAIVKKQQRPETRLERIERLTGFNPCLCPVCKTGRMVRVRELPRIRSPAHPLTGQPQ